MKPSDRFAADLENLLEKYTDARQFPKFVAPHMATKEWYVCELCDQLSDEEAVAIPHEATCLAGKVQEMLLDA